jgi:hypothetical protein
MSQRAPEIGIISRDLGDEDRFEYHPKLRARLEESLANQRMKLEGCKKDELDECQATVAALKMMLAMPEQMKQEERQKRAKENHGG